MNPKSNSSLPVSISGEPGLQFVKLRARSFSLRVQVISRLIFFSQTTAWNVLCSFTCVGWEHKGNWAAFRSQRVWGNGLVKKGLAIQAWEPEFLSLEPVSGWDITLCRPGEGEGRDGQILEAPWSASLTGIASYWLLRRETRSQKVKWKVSEEDTLMWALTSTQGGSGQHRAHT